MRRLSGVILLVAGSLVVACSSSSSGPDVGADAKPDQLVADASSDGPVADRGLDILADLPPVDTLQPDLGPPPQDVVSTSNGKATRPVLAVDGQKVYLAWEDARHGAPEIYFRRSLDGGKTWKAEQRLTNDTVVSTWPALAVDGSGAVHIVWRDKSLGHWSGFYAVSTDAGKTFSQPVDITKYPGSFDFTHPTAALAATGTKIYLAWDDNRSGVHDVYLRVSDDGGKSWSPTKDLDKARSFCQNIAVTTGAANVAHFGYVDASSGKTEIIYTRTTDGGKTVEPSIPLSGVGSNTWGDYSPPGLAANSKSDVIAGFITSQRLELRHSGDGGKTWDKAVVLSTAGNRPSTTHTHANGVTALDGQKGYVVYSDLSAGSKNSEVFLVRSQDAGKTWGQRERVTTMAGASRLPRLALDATQVHIVWIDNRDGGDEVYYTRLLR